MLISRVHFNLSWLLLSIKWQHEWSWACFWISVHCSLFIGTHSLRPASFLDIPELVDVPNILRGFSSNSMPPIREKLCLAEASLPFVTEFGVSMNEFPGKRGGTQFHNCSDGRKFYLVSLFSFRQIFESYPSSPFFLGLLSRISGSHCPGDPTPQPPMTTASSQPRRWRLLEGVT